MTLGGGSTRHAGSGVIPAGPDAWGRRCHLLSLASFIAVPGRADREITGEPGNENDARAVTVPATSAVAAGPLMSGDSSPRCGIGVRSALCFSARRRWFQDRACLVDGNSADGRQGGSRRQVMVAAQQ